MKSYQQVAMLARRRVAALRHDASMLLDRNQKDTADTTLDAGDIVAGWRLVRPLTQDRSEFVGVAEYPSTVASSGSEHWSGFAESARPRLQHRRIVVASGAAACAKLAEECSLRDEVGSEFVELAEETLVDGVHRIAIFPIRQVRTWAEVVAREVELSAAAAVTALVPVVEALQLAHRHGIAHGTMSLHACVIDENGKPGLDGWGSAVRTAGLTSVKADLARGNDLRGLGKIVDALLATCAQPPSEPLRLLVGALCDGVTPSDATGRLIDALFQWAEPGPLPEAVLPGSAPPSASNARNDSATRVASPLDLLGLANVEEDEDEPLITPTEPKSRRQSFTHLVEKLSHRFAGLSNWVGRIRPTLWAGVGVVGLIVLLGGALLVSTSGASAEKPAEPVAAETDLIEPTSGGEPVGFDTEADSGTDTDTDTDTDNNTDTEVPEDSTPPKTALQTAPELVTARNECLASTDIECLTDLYAPDAPGLAADLAALSGGTPEQLSLNEEQEWLLAADLGDIELISGSEAGSLSLERTSEGWLLREIWLPELPQ